MDSPLTTWYCDVCGGVIDTPQNGYAVWNSKNGLSDGYNIIHTECEPDGDYTNTLALTDFLGARGLAECMALLSVGPLKRARGEKQQRGVVNLDRFVDFVRRVQTPYYEEARRYFKDSRLRRDFSDSNEIIPYLPESLKEIIERYSG